MLHPGKMKEIANEILKFKCDVVGLQEIRWQGNGQIDKPEYSLVYSGPEERTGQYGTGFIITREIRRSLLEFEPINERICRLRLRGKFRNTTIVNAHAPTEEKEDIIKEQFYDDLEKVCCAVPKYDLMLVIGDFNAKIGRNEHQHGISGKYSLHEENSENGDLLCQFARRNNMIIKSTCFPHKRIHLGTWKSAVSGVVNQIDHVLVTARHSTSIIDVRSCRGPNCDSDHFMIKSVLREKLSLTNSNRTGKRMNWNTDKLKIPDEVKRYQQTLNRKLNNEETAVGADERWSRIEKAIKDAAEETIGIRRNRRIQEWFDEDCRSAIEEKNRARKKCYKEKPETMWNNIEN